MDKNKADDTEITPEMIEAGVAVAREYDWVDADYENDEHHDEADRVRGIFLAMMLAKQVGASR